MSNHIPAFYALIYHILLIQWAFYAILYHILLIQWAFLQHRCESSSIQLHNTWSSFWWVGTHVPTKASGTCFQFSKNRSWSLLWYKSCFIFIFLCSFLSFMLSVSICLFSFFYFLLSFSHAVILYFRNCIIF